MIKVKGRKINPEKSNKMIWAVGAGLAVLFSAIVFWMTWEPLPKDHRQLIDKTLAYLKNVRGIFAVDVGLAPDRVTLVYDSSFSQDFPRIARYAAVRLAGRLPDFELDLARNRADRVVRRIEVRAGAIVSDQTVEPSGPDR